MAPQPTEDPRKAVRDPIHGLIPRYRQEIRLMNTSVFQRLRRIRQLAMAHLVYPGALHTRFDHSLGTMHVAARICERIEGFGKIDKDETRIVRLAALLHDIGHGPFSHVTEYLLERHYSRQALGDLGTRAKIHERLTAQLVGENPEITKVLTPQERQGVLALLTESTKRDFKRDIISSSLDADKMDYLLRDSYFAGVRYGSFDLEKIIDASRVHEEVGAESYLALDHEGIYAFEQLAMAKYHMAQQVYFHRIRAITDAMLVRGVNIAMRDGDAEVSSIFRYDGSSEFLERYLAYDDEKLLRRLAESEHCKVSDLFRRLSQRRLFKQICDVPLEPESVKNAIVRDRLARLEPETRWTRAVEEAIGEKLAIDPDFVVVTRRSVGNPTFRSASDRLDFEEILILDRDGTPRKASDFLDVSFAFNTTAQSRQSIQVYAPKDEWNDPEAETGQERNECQRAVQETIVQHVS